jgi:fructokinase
MPDPAALADRLAAAVLALPERADRTLVALAGPPGAGKSTLAAAVVPRLAAAGRRARVVPMDGFHYDNAVLGERGLVARKGAPETFDVAGLAHLLARLRREDEVAIPLFDRAADLARAAAAVVTAADRTLIVEGNYLLLDEDPWRGLAAAFDLRVALEVPEAELEARLVARWTAHGLDAAAARARALGNDLPNARRVARRRLPADLVLAG